MTAVGGYLRTIREGRKIVRARLAEELDVDPTTLWRIEEGKQEPGGELLLSLIAAVRADYNDVRRLMRDRDATEETGRSAALSRLTQAEQDELEALRATFGDNDVAETIARLAADPELLSAILRLGDVVGKGRGD